MNLISLFAILISTVVICLEVVIIAKPVHQNRNKKVKGNNHHFNSNRGNNSNTNGDGKRSTRSGRKLRMLLKILKRLSPEDVWELTQSRRDRNSPKGSQFMESQILHITSAQQQQQQAAAIQVPGMCSITPFSVSHSVYWTWEKFLVKLLPYCEQHRFVGWCADLGFFLVFSCSECVHIDWTFLKWR